MHTVPPANPTRVVIVDDEPALADGLAELLTLEGFSAKAAYGGAEAIALVKTFEPHCVILDIGMPGIDGAELASRLRKAHGDDIILLAMTGRDVRDPSVLSTYAMVDHYFAKPVELDALLKVLRTS
jgi:DNA-binding response OmpR family regulator